MQIQSLEDTGKHWSSKIWGIWVCLGVSHLHCFQRKNSRYNETQCPLTVLPLGDLWLSSLSVSSDCPLWLYQVVLRSISCSISCCMWMSTNNWAKDTHDCLLRLSLLQWLAGMLSSSTSVIRLISKGDSQPLLEKVLEKTHSSRDGPGESTAEQRLYSRYLLTTALPTYTPWWWTS